jgi:hypothetical protein
VSPRRTRRSRKPPRTGAPDADQQRRYFVPLLLGLVVLDPLELGLEVEPDDGVPLVVSVVLELLELEPDGVVLLDGGVVLDGGIELDGGEADGVRSPGFSPTRSVRDSLQAVSSPALSATAMAAVSILFISEPSSLWGLRSRCPKSATRMPPPAA